MENILSFLGTILTVMTALIGLLATWRRTVGWPRWQSIPVTIVVSTMSVLCVMAFIAILFDDPADELGIVDDVSGVSPPLEITGQNGEADTEPEMRMEVRNRTFEFSRTNNHCESTDEVRWQVTADEGWEIDVTSIESNVTTRSSKSSYDGVVGATIEGFFIEGRLTNNGDCIRLFGKVVARDGRGRLRVTGSYQETRLVPAAS